MFRHPFEIKSNSQIKLSERKVVKEKFGRSFYIPDEDLNDLFTKKSSVHNVKLLTHDNHTVHVYVVNKVPLGFLCDDILYPTVFLLWKYPNLFHSFTTHENVTKYIKSGADLMLPGVCFPDQSAGSAPVNKYGNVQKGQIVYVNLTTNRAAFAVGTAAKSSAEMISSGGRGKCVIILHFYGDKLSKFEGLSMTYPEFGPPLVEMPELLELQREQKQSLEAKAEPTSSTSKEMVTQEIEEKLSEPLLDEKESSDTFVENTVEEMDNLLKHCFFTAIKYSKTLKLPILTSTFYKVEMLPLCPPDKKLDIKKSSFKKMKTFLDHMQQLRILVVKETSKGVESIISIDKENQNVREFYASPENRPKVETAAEDDKTVVEKFMITPSVSAVFVELGYKKGDTLLPIEIRKFATTYVKNNHLQNAEHPGLVKPNTAIAKICKTEEYVTWEKLMEDILNSMKKCLEVKSGQEEIVTKGETPKIAINVATRSGNKKVTLVDHLELYGINLAEFARDCMHGVAASTSISKPPGKKYEQLMVQGNQVIFVHNLLIDKYKIPKKFIIGLANAPKKKKK